MADSTPLTIIQSTAESLDAVLCYGATPNTIRAGPQRYLFVVEPADLRFWRPGDDVSLLCLTDNKAQTFWSYVAERQDDEAFADRTRSWTYAPHLAESYSKYVISRLPCDGEVSLQYAPLPATFDVTLIEAYGVPGYDSGASTSSYAKSRMTALQASIKARNTITGQTLDAYNMIRPWTEAGGLFCKQFGPLNAKLLFDMVLALDQSADVVAEFVRLYSIDACVSAALKPYPHNFYKSDQAWISREVSRLGNDRRALQATHAIQTIRFRQEYAHFVQIKSRCWAAKSQHKTRERLTRLVPTVRELVAPLSDISLRVWPSEYAPVSVAAGEHVAIMLVGVDTTSQAALKQLRASLEEYCANNVAKLEDEDSQISIDLQARDAVKDYRPIELTRTAGTVAASPCKQSSNPRSTSTSPPEGDNTTAKRKFRTAGQTLSRLRWDPSHKLQQYEVGYIDRFDGLIWLPLEVWGKAVEEEDFIPEHRIQQFRRLDDKSIVWDRARKIDLTGQT